MRCVGGRERTHGERGGNHLFRDPCVLLWRDLEHCVCVFICVRRQFFIMCGCDESGVKRETNNNGQNNMITDYSEITS